MSWRRAREKPEVQERELREQTDVNDKRIKNARWASLRIPVVCIHHLFRICQISLSLRQKTFYKKPDSHYLFYYGTIALEEVNNPFDP